MHCLSEPRKEEEGGMGRMGRVGRGGEEGGGQKVGGKWVGEGRVGGRGPDRETVGKGKEGFLKKLCPKKVEGGEWVMKRQSRKLPTARM